MHVTVQFVNTAIKLDTLTIRHRISTGVHVSQYGTLCCTEWMWLECWI